jgi:hypothetical protein
MKYFLIISYIIETIFGGNNNNFIIITKFITMVRFDNCNSIVCHKTL